MTAKWVENSWLSGRLSHARRCAKPGRMFGGGGSNPTDPHRSANLNGVAVGGRSYNRSYKIGEKGMFSKPLR